MKLIYAFPSWMTDGLFARLGDWTPWDEDEDVDKNALDIEYFGNRSGLREVSPLLVKMMFTPEGPELSDVEVSRLDLILRSRYRDAWQRRWDALLTPYKPLENYNMTEEGYDRRAEENSSTTSTAAETTSTATTETDMKTTTKGKSKNKTDNTVTDSVHAFGADDYTPITRNVTDGSVTSLLADNESETTVTADPTKNISTTTFEADPTKNITTVARESDPLKNYTHHKLERSGNIGVTTSQQMLQAELELRKTTFFDYVYECLDQLLTIPYWRGGPEYGPKGI